MDNNRCRNWLTTIGSLIRAQNRFIPAMIFFFGIGFSAQAADESPSGKVTADSAEFQAHAKEAASAYKIQRGSDPAQELSFHHGSILRWSNPVGGKETHGEVFLWTDRGRPEVVLSLYEFVGSGDVVREQHEFCSLSSTKLTARTPQKALWAPRAAGLKMEPLPDAAAPADSARARLREMRTYAERFTSDKTTREGVTRQLRLLTQPIYRYDGTHPEILDGALYAYVEATDPEILLLIEARSKDQGYEWTFGFARLNSVQLRAFYLEKTIWEASLLSWRDALDRADEPYTAFRIR